MQPQPVVPDATRILGLFPHPRRPGVAVIDRWGVDTASFSAVDLRRASSEREREVLFRERMQDYVLQYHPTRIALVTDEAVRGHEAFREFASQAARAYELPIDEVAADDLRPLLASSTHEGRDRLAQAVVRLFAPNLSDRVHLGTASKDAEQRRRLAPAWKALGGAFLTLASRHPREATALCTGPVPAGLVSFIRHHERRIHPCGIRV